MKSLDWNYTSIEDAFDKHESIAIVSADGMGNRPIAGLHCIMTHAEMIESYLDRCHCIRRPAVTESTIAGKLEIYIREVGMDEPVESIPFYFELMSPEELRLLKHRQAQDASRGPKRRKHLQENPTPLMELEASIRRMKELGATNEEIYSFVHNSWNYVRSGLLATVQEMINSL